MAFFGGGDSFSRSFNTTLNTAHYTPSGTPRPSSGTPRPSSGAGQSVSRPSPGCEDTVSLSNEAQGGPATDPINDFRVKTLQMQQQARETQLTNLLKQVGF